MDEETQLRRISAWSSALNDVRTLLEQRLGVDPGDYEITRAVLVKLGYGLDSTRLAQREWSAADLLDLLQDIDFVGNADAEVVALFETVLPPGAPGRLDEETIKRNGEVWRVHRHDVDPFPSSPHAHNVASDLKLDLTDGSLYRGTTHVGAIKKKDLLAIRSAIKRIPLPALTV